MFHWLVRKVKPSTKRIARRSLHLEILEDRTAPALLGQQLFPADNPWNQAITNAPVAANSAAIMNNIVSNYGDGRLHPDFGQDSHASQDLYGIPFNIVHGNSTAKVNVVIDGYPDESDLLNTPIPASVVLEGDFQNGPKVGVDNRGDSHLIVWDVDNNIAYEFYRASRPSENSDGKWHADQESVWNMNTDTFRTVGFTSADAAGLSILAGLVRPDEALPVSQGGQGVINHAIRFTLQNSIILDQFIYPASHVANSNNNPAIEPPMGARFRLKASVDISQLSPQSRIIAQAMKTYGMIVADNGSNFYFSGASDSVDASNHLTLTWNDNDIQDSVHGLKSLHYSDFEVVDMTPVVTGLSATSGLPGAQTTVTGKNFSGAAGALHVYFGSTQATSVTYVDDGHLLVTIPIGSGVVDVRVQSGQSTAADSDNIKSTVFGYGTSAVSANDRFIFGSSAGNTAPTVATAATASPAITAGTTTQLSVLGADDGGEANLTYTWSVHSKPTGAATPSFSANGTNAAKHATATLSMVGSYTFDVTIRDVWGLTATSTVTVTVVAFTAPSAVSPTGTTSSAMPAFTWKPVTGADHYDVWVSSVVNGVEVTNAPVLQITNINGTSWTPSSSQALNPGHAYKWYVASVKSDGTHLWNSGMLFNIAPLAKPTAVSPSGTIATDRPAFTWKAVTNAVHYEIWVNSVVNGSEVVNAPVLQNTNASGTSWTPSSAQALSPGHAYEWYVAAVSKDGTHAWNGGVQFNVAALAKPIATSPIGTITTATPTFTWNAVADAAHYYIWVNAVVNGSEVLNAPVLKNATLTGTSWKTSTALTRNRSYVWYIGAVSNDGTTVWSAGKTFFITA